jgi:hypothetical protein
MRMMRVDDTMPSNRFMKIVSTLNRRQAAVLMQLRTGAVPLNEHLFKTSCIDTPACKCDMSIETVKHYLIECPLWNKQRRSLYRSLGRRSREVKTLLSNPKVIKDTLRFVAQTGRFKETFGDVNPSD